MRSPLLRIALAGLLITTVGVRIWIPQTAELDVRAGVIALAAREGWSAYDEAANSRDSLGKAINFSAPGCEEVVQVFAIDLGLQLAPMLDGVIRPGYTRRFVYLGRTWFAQDRVGMRLEWLKNRVLSLFGLGRYVANETALVIAEPLGCRMADNVNWSAVWQRDTKPGSFPSRSL